MKDEDLQFVTRVETLAKHAFLELSTADVVLVCGMVREQDKRARHAEQERDAYDARISELEEQLRRCKEHKERNDAISFRVQRTREGQIAELEIILSSLEKRLEEQSSRESALHVMLASYGLPTEPKALARDLAQLRSDAEAWRKGQEVLSELRERAIPCGHKVEDLIGGEGHVTKCGACLAAKQAERKDKP